MSHSPASSPASSGICSGRCRWRSCESSDIGYEGPRTGLRLRLRTPNRKEGNKVRRQTDFCSLRAPPVGGSSQGPGGWPMHDDVNHQRGLTAAPTYAPRQCGHDVPMNCRYPIHVDQHDHGSPRDLHQRTRLCPVPVHCHRCRGFLLRCPMPRTIISFFSLDSTQLYQRQR